ncbi:MAG: hypothetical protein MI684_00830, partial [Chlorobiales bacterium]|nr:hypothetical protein [Chlorobiales bacterium]
MGTKTGNIPGNFSGELVDVGVESTEWYTGLTDLLKNIPGGEEGFAIALLGKIAGYSGIGKAVGLTYIGMKSLDEGEKRFWKWLYEKTGGEQGYKHGGPYLDFLEGLENKGEIKKKRQESYDTRTGVFSTSFLMNSLPGHLSSVGNENAANNIELETVGENIKAMSKLENESDNVKDSIVGLGLSINKNLSPNVKDLADNVEQFDEVSSKDLQVGKEYMFGQFGLDENEMPLGGLPKREYLLVGGQELSVTESEKEDIGDIQKGIKKQVSVLNHVADGLDVVGYDLKGVGSFSTAIEQLTLASKLGGTAGFDSTKAYVAGISSLFQGIGANIGGDVGAALSSMGSMAATGASIGSAIPGVGTVAGAVVGGAVGLISSIFGGDDEEERKEAEREKMRQQIYQGMLSRSLSGAGPHSLKMLRESGWDYDKLKKQFGGKDEEELIKYQNRLELLDDIGASLEKIGSPEIVRSIDQVRAKYEYAAKSVEGMLDIASAELTEISALVFGLTADNLVTMFDSAIETAEDAGHAGRLIAEALELQIVDSFKKMAISQAVNEAVMPMLQPILNELVAGALSGGLSPGEMAD